MVPHASVSVMCRCRHAPSRGNRKKSPLQTPQMYGFSTSEHASLVIRGAKIIASRPAPLSASPRRAASSMPLQKLAAFRVCNRAMIR